MEYRTGKVARVITARLFEGEVLGVGTIYTDDNTPKLHIHTAMGKGGNILSDVLAAEQELSWFWR